MIEIPTKQIWTGRFDDEDGELGLRWHQVVDVQNLAQSTYRKSKSIAILGFCSDEGVRRNKGRVGARNAPNEIRKSLANLPYNPHQQKELIDFGNILLEDHNLEKARSEQIEFITQLLTNNYFPIILGGGHETALGNYLALSRQEKRIGILNIDAHFDLRIPVEQSTSGTPFFEMAQFCQENNREFQYSVVGIQPNGNTEALFQRAKELNVQTILAEQIHADLPNTLHCIENYISEFDALYLSIDLDVLDGAFAPGVSAPSVDGLTSHEMKTILKMIHQSGKVKLVDIVELNPELDQDNRTAKLAANLIQIFTFN